MFCPIPSGKYRVMVIRRIKERLKNDQITAAERTHIGYGSVTNER
jgi:hypothetical protein